MFGVDDIILGATIAGGATSFFGASKKAKAQKALYKNEIQQNELRKQQMELDALRAQRQLIRNVQMTRAVGEVNQVGAGANFGSAAGGLAGQIQGQRGVNENTIWQNLQIGRQMFALQNQAAMFRTQANDAQGIMDIGSAISRSGPALGRMFGGRSFPFESEGSWEPTVQYEPLK